MAETRKIVAILVADIVGYSRLAGADEDRTQSRLRGLRSDLINPAIDAHHGTAASSNFAVWSTPCAAPSRYRMAWPSATPACRPSAASSFALAFIWATLSKRPMAAS